MFYFPPEERFIGIAFAIFFFSYQEAMDRISIQKCIMLQSDKMSNAQAKGMYFLMQHDFWKLLAPVKLYK